MHHKEIEVIDMIDITYLDSAKQERVMHFDSLRRV